MITITGVIHLMLAKTGAFGAGRKWDLSKCRIMDSKVLEVSEKGLIVHKAAVWKKFSAVYETSEFISIYRDDYVFIFFNNSDM